MTIREEMEAFAEAEAEARREEERRRDPRFPLSDDRLRRLCSADVVVVTSALNNTDVHHPGFSNLLRYATDRDAEIVVLTQRYKNPTDFREHAKGKYQYWWPPEVVRFLCDSDVLIHEHLQIAGRTPIQATAANPLAGLRPLTRGRSTIVGSSQVAMETVPTPQHALPVILHSTGSISRDDNYSDTKAGRVGEFHHSLGFVVFERAGDLFHLRHVSMAEDGSFYDLDRYYGPDAWGERRRVAGLVCGDLHAWWLSDVVRRATFEGPESMAAVLRPRQRVLHDLLDFYSANHHHQRRHLTNVAKHAFGRQRIEHELWDTLRVKEDTRPDDCVDVVVRSNHDAAFDRWLHEVDIRREPWNAKIYHEASALVIGAMEMGDGQAKIPSALKLWAQSKTPETIWLDVDDPYEIAGVLVSLHGDRGPHGSRGTHRNLADLGTKVMVGDKHHPAIVRGLYGVGTSTPLSLEYTSGPSAWMNTHGIIHENGKRQLANVLPDGSWRGAA